MTVLLREAIGDRLRHTRTDQCRTLREVSRSARVSLGYLSEVERGRKEASSELLASICQALELPLDELLRHVAGDVGTGYLSQVPDTVPDELVSEGRAPESGTGLPELRVSEVGQVGEAMSETTTSTGRRDVAVVAA